MAEIDLLYKHEQDFRNIQTLGGQYDIQTIIIERRKEDWVGRGNAWGPEQGGGTVNTGPEAGAGRLDYAQRLGSYYCRNHERLAKSYEGDHPIAHSMLKSAFDGTAGAAGEPATQQAAITRSEQGAEELASFNAAIAQARTRFPFYRLAVHTETSVEMIDISNPSQPRVALADADTGESKGVLQADTIRANTGTPLVSPIQDEAVAKHSFIRAMAPGELRAFLDAKGLLDKSGRLAPGTRLAIGGTMLSAYDPLIALQETMQLFEPDDSAVGFKVSDEAKRKYQGAITFISKTPGVWIPPRHAHSPQWTQASEPLGSAAEQHALFLHNQGEEVFDTWMALAVASVALATGTLPSDVCQQGMTTEDLLRAQYASSVQHGELLVQAKHLDGEAKRLKLAQATRTLEGAKRQAFLSTILGLGMTRSIEDAISSMNAMAPLGFRGRHGYAMHRAQLKAITEPGSKLAQNNGHLIKAFDTLMRDVTSSPFRVHAAAPLLVEAGIACYQSGSYGDFRAGTGEHALSFTTTGGSTRDFDAFLVLPTISRDAEPATRSLSGQVMPAEPSVADLPQVTTNRRVLSIKGEPTNLEDYGLNGKGTLVPGTRSRVGAFATDTNNRDSGVDVAPGLAYRHMAQVHLATAGFVDPAGEVERLLHKHLKCDEKAFATETGRFKPHYEAAIAKGAFVKPAQTLAAGNATTFATLMYQAARNGGNTVKNRVTLFDPVFGDVVRKRADPSHVTPPGVALHRKAAHQYAATLDAKSGYSPASHVDYQKRFVDVPLHVHEAVYREAHALALERAQASRARTDKSSSGPVHQHANNGT